MLCSLDLELQVVVSEQVQVLGTKLRFSTQPLCLAPVTQRVVSLCQQVCWDLLLCALGSISHPVDIPQSCYPFTDRVWMPPACEPVQTNMFQRSPG